MLKKFVISIIAFLLVSCSNKKTLNIEELSNKVIKELNIEEKVEKIDKENIENILYLDENVLEDGILYVSKENKADIVCILKSNDISKLQNNINDYLEIISNNNANYFPEELEKLNNAIIKVKGDYLIFIVSDNNGIVNKIIEN